MTRTEPKGDASEPQSALNRALLQKKILASTPMVDEAQACELLGPSTASPSVIMKRKEDQGAVLRVTIDGRAIYPLFQFDVQERRIFPSIAKLIALKPDTWSSFRLMHWLTRPHLDFGAPPAQQLGTGDAKVIAAFKREATPPKHG